MWTACRYRAVHMRPLTCPGAAFQIRYVFGNKKAARRSLVDSRRILLLFYSDMIRCRCALLWSPPPLLVALPDITVDVN